jgi:hypothetical protein
VTHSWEVWAKQEKNIQVETSYERRYAEEEG